MQAIILAAGMGKRLKDLTADNTKCMVKVNGKSLIERALDQLDQLGLNRIVIVTGYEGEKLKDYISHLSPFTPIRFVDNPIFDKTNNIYSLYLAKDYLAEDDTLLLESDLIFEDGILEDLVNDPRPTLALVDKYESWMDGTVVKLDEADNITAFIPGKRFAFEDIPSYYKTVNIYKFSKAFSETHYIPFLEAYSSALGNNEYYEQVLRVITLLDDSTVKAKRLDGQLWYEIDDLQDLNIAESIFATDEHEKLGAMERRYGGYWRYPKLIDFCYLVNPFFPPQRLLDEMKANFDTLVRQYPSGMAVNSLLAAKTFGLKPEHVLVGNGAAELIKDLMEIVDKPVGSIKPTFEEYPNRLSADQYCSFVPETSEFRYTAEDIIRHYSDSNVRTIVLINPDNPSGNYIPKEDCLRLAEWCEQQAITLILDESFVDFSDEPNASLLDESILKRYPNLLVIKSISKSYGVPGLRLGILASSNEDLVSQMKKTAAIWNINSFGEFFFQIAEKYLPDYKDSLVKIRSARANLMLNLEAVPGLHPIPSQANYILVELEPWLNSTKMSEHLLSNNNILIKDLSKKKPFESGRYIRLAVRDEDDNQRLITALSEYLPLVLSAQE